MRVYFDWWKAPLGEFGGKKQKNIYIIPMKELVNRIRDLEKISANLEPPESERNEYMRSVHNYVNRFISQLGTVKTFSDEKVKKDALSLNFKKNSLDSLIEVYESEVAAKGIYAASGGHMGYVPGGGVYTASLGDYLADITNEYAGLFFAAPGSVIMENEILNWLKSIFGFPEDSAGNLTSGGSIANLIALTAARDDHKIKGQIIEKKCDIHESADTSLCE
jgi:hypothetical protein